MGVLNAAFRVFRWTRRHKLTSAGLCGAALLGVYGAVFVVVGCASSPTDRSLRLVDGRELAYLRWTSGGDPAVRVVLVHGAPADASSWTRLRTHAEGVPPDTLPGIEWVAVDRLGYGNSATETELSLGDHARSLEPWLRGAPPGGVILVGHSYGGPVALRAAADYPDRVRGIVLVAGACDAFMKDSRWFRRAVEGVSVAVPASWAAANRELLALTEENRAMEGLLTRVTCPVVVVHGTWDPVCPYDGTVGYLESRLTNSAGVTVVRLERAGHNLHLSHPERILEQIGLLARGPEPMR